MRISDLWDKYRLDDIYIVGTGPSMRFMPLDIIHNKITIGLNQAYRYCPLTYSITVHPELVLEYLKLKSPNPTQWIIKKKPPMDYLNLDDKRFYVFTTDPHPHESNPKYIRNRIPDKLYQGHGIQQTAMNLAAQMGAKSIILVGVDMCSLGDEHHGHDQHVRFHGQPSELVYKEYRKFTGDIRKIIRDELKIPVLTLSPFIGVGNAEEDYQRLLAEFKLQPLPKPKDTSKYLRHKLDL